MRDASLWRALLGVKKTVIEQAKGITAFKNAVTVDQAYRLIRRHARNNNASLRMVAEAIVAVGLQL